MKIFVFSLCRNEADILPFYLRHYSAFADRIFVWDDQSTDGSRELLLANPKVTLNDWSHDSGIDEDLFLQFAYATYPLARGQADWVIWVDCDEFIYDPDLEGVLREAQEQQYEVVQTVGFNMAGDGLPADDGRQIWEILVNGVSAPVYSKPVVFRPECEIRWNRGKHDLEQCNVRLSPLPMLKLLHYRYLGAEYTRRKNLKNYDRVGLKTGDKSHGWSCSPDWKGDHSPEWAEAIKAKAYPVV